MSGDGGSRRSACLTGRKAGEDNVMPIRPNTYVLGSIIGFGRSPCRSSNIASAALFSIGRAEIHPSWYSLGVNVRMFMELRGGRRKAEMDEEGDKRNRQQ